MGCSMDHADSHALMPVDSQTNPINIIPKPMLVEPMVKHKMSRLIVEYNKAKNTSPGQFTIFCRQTRHIYDNHLKKHIYIIMFVLIMTGFLYYRYRLKKQRDEDGIEPNDDDILDSIIF